MSGARSGRRRRLGSWTKLGAGRRKTAAEGQEPGPAAPAGAKPKSWSWPAELADLIEERYSAGESGEAIVADLGVGQS